ncbi:hypothetical protein [Metabacillus arenae]|uniref:Uncharacterized protein n=1 Tax=Metabacillus arenae TaxID=2771434 RepID=A0A926NSW1_9BACI|nr:hypothetical protein [Metabacillus arenae]MBD1383316.1 hypothetical protein [Metabacillus arenae]
MKTEEILLTEQERVIVQKLKQEMYNALTLKHMNFYKEEIEKIYAQAKRRQSFVTCHVQKDQI